jgi:hypothetical protein
MSRARQLADQVHAFLQDACSDLAYTVDPEFFEGKIAAALDQAKREGVRDIKGWLADYLYNDPDTLHDFAGDKICDLTDGDEVLAAEVLKELKRALPQMERA